MKNNTRIATLEVNMCSMCPFLDDTSFGNYCTKTHPVNIHNIYRKISNILTIPIWCPLPRFKSEKTINFLNDEKRLAEVQKLFKEAFGNKTTIEILHSQRKNE